MPRTGEGKQSIGARTGLIDNKAACVQNGGTMTRSVRDFLAASILLLTLPAAHAQAALEPAQFEATLTTARDYADDRSLIFFCLRGSTETVPFLYAGLQADIEQAVQKMKTAGASSRQTAEMVQMVLANVRYYPRDAKDDALDRRCILKDVERSRAEVKGVSIPLSSGRPSTSSATGKLRTGDHLAVDVKRGENANKTLKHSGVVRLLQRGKIASASETVTLKLDEKWKRENLRVVAFVQSTKDRRVVSVGYSPVR